MITVKLRKIGNSLGVILPARAIAGKQAGDSIGIEVITDVITKAENVITSEPEPNRHVITPTEPQTKRNPYAQAKPSPKPYTGELTKARQVSAKGFKT